MHTSHTHIYIHTYPHPHTHTHTHTPTSPYTHTPTHNTQPTFPGRLLAATPSRIPSRVDVGCIQHNSSMRRSCFSRHYFAYQLPQRPVHTCSQQHCMRERGWAPCRVVRGIMKGFAAASAKPMQRFGKAEPWDSKPGNTLRGVPVVIYIYFLNF